MEDISLSLDERHDIVDREVPWQTLAYSGRTLPVVSSSGSSCRATGSHKPLSSSTDKLE